MSLSSSSEEFVSCSSSSSSSDESPEDLQDKLKAMQAAAEASLVDTLQTALDEAQGETKAASARALSLAEQVASLEQQLAQSAAATRSAQEASARAQEQASILEAKLAAAHAMVDSTSPSPSSPSDSPSSPSPSPSEPPAEARLAEIEEEVVLLSTRLRESQNALREAQSKAGMEEANSKAALKAVKNKAALDAAKWDVERAKLVSELAEANAACNELTSEVAYASSKNELLASKVKLLEGRVAELEAQIEAAAAAVSSSPSPVGGETGEGQEEEEEKDTLSSVAATLAELDELSSGSGGSSGEGGKKKRKKRKRRKKRSHAKHSHSPAGSPSGGGRRRVPARAGESSVFSQGLSLDPESMRALADKLSDIEVGIAKQLKVLDGVSMVRESFSEGSQERVRADEQYGVLAQELAKLEAERNIIESQLSLPVTPRIVLGKRKKKKRARSDTILRKIKSTGTDVNESQMSSVLQGMSQDALRDRLGKVAKNVQRKKQELSGLKTFLKPDSPFKYEANSSAHSNLMTQIADAKAEIADLSALHDAIVAELGISDQELGILEARHELTTVSAAIDRDLELRESMAESSASESDTMMVAHEEELRKLMAREDELFAIIGEENPRAPLYDPASYSEVLVAVYDYDPREPHELKLEEGDRIGALEDYGDGWSYGVILISDEEAMDAPISFGAMGLFPTSYAEPE